MKFLNTILIFGLIAFFSNCEKLENNEEEVLNVDQNGNSNMNQHGLKNKLKDFPLESLSVEEIAGLQFMREEEKLAHDVYTAFYEKYDITIFKNISNSEQTHTDAVFALLERYELEDPAKGMLIGEFTNEILKDLYDGLISRGQESEIEALRIGAKVEEIDILDLMRELDTVVDNQDIQFVYENLLRGSRNHLRAYVSNLASRNVEYEPEHLDLELYTSIIESDMEHGHG